MFEEGFEIKFILGACILILLGFLGYKIVDELGKETVGYTTARATILDARISESSSRGMVYTGNGFMYVPTSSTDYITEISLNGELYTLGGKKDYYSAYQHIGKEVELKINVVKNRQGEEEYYIDSILNVVDEQVAPSQNNK